MCEIHFEEDDFHPVSRYLKGHAVPTLHLPPKGTKDLWTQDEAKWWLKINGGDSQFNEDVIAYVNQLPVHQPAQGNFVYIF